MKAIVDCGAFKGAVLNLFKNHDEYSDFTKFYAFECHPDLNKDYGTNVEVIEKAVWIENRELKFFVDPQRSTSQGHSVHGDKITGNLDNSNPLIVNAIDFSNWLKDTFTEDDYVVVKMNIEGAEYEVLNKCIDDGSINFINELYIRWHQHKIPSIPLQVHEDLKQKLSTYDIKIYEDYSRLKESKGLLLVAFGEEYDNLAAHTMKYSRKYTKLPIQVLSNLKKRSRKWDEVSNVTFTFIDEDVNNNRAIKTRMDKYIVFDKTIYIDCDSVINNKGIEKIFDLIENDKILLCKFPYNGNINSLAIVYKNMFDLVDISESINVYFGAFIGFSKKGVGKNIFPLWNSYWKKSGSGREMPALAAAVHHSGVPVIELPKGIFSWKEDSEISIIKHEFRNVVKNLVGCSEFVHYKPFDKKCNKKIVNPVFDLIPEIVQIELTTVCNAKCSYCRRQKVGSINIGNMNFDLFKKIIDQSPKKALIKISGAGEPTLYPKFIEAMKYAKSKNKRIWLITNGSKLSGDILNCILNNVYKLDISIDSYDKIIYEDIRGLSFDNLKSNILNLMKKKEHHPIVSVIVVEDPNNLKESQKTIIYWREIIKRVKRSRLVDQTQPPKALYSSKEPVACENFRTTKSLNIKYNGDVTLCCHDIGNYVMGNVNKTNMLQIFNSTKFINTRRSMNTGVGYPLLCDYCRGIV